MGPEPRHPHIEAYLAHARSQGRTTVLGDLGLALDQYVAYLAGLGRQPATATAADVEAYRAVLGTPAASLDGRILAETTQGTRLGTVRAFHRFLVRRGLAFADPTVDISLPRIPTGQVRKDFLTLQEAEAFLATAAAAVEAAQPGSATRARAMRDLAMLAVALATGRRRSGLLNLHVEHLDVERQALRVEREKGSIGRVLPVAPWAVAVVRAYRDEARGILLRDRASPWLFVGLRGERVGGRTYDELVRRTHRATCTACPDLADLPTKAISTHGLRVTTARLLFLGGCPIRVVSDMLLHQKLTTTARYTPLALEDLRRVVESAHPRA